MLTTSEKLQLSLKLRSIADLQAQLFESLIDAETPREILANVDQLHTRSAELLAAVVGLCRAPTELPFVGANVEIPGERTPAEDKASQFVLERRRAG